MNRRYDFDWLRLFGAVMVVVAHCGMVFSPWFPTIGSMQKDKWFSELGWNLNLWLMPLFMLLAGASVWYTLGKRSNREYLRERLLHLGLPLLVLMPTFIVPASYVSSQMKGQFSGSLAEFYLHFFDGNFTFFHLWFLAYLLLYAFLTLPLFRLFQTDAGRHLIDRLARVCQPMGGIYVFALPLLVVQLALTGIAPPPEFAITNDWVHLASLLLVFVFGYILISDARFQEAIRQQWPLTVIVALVTWIVLFAIVWPDDYNPVRDLPTDYSLPYVAFWTVFTISSWSWVMAWLGLAQRFLNVNHTLLQRAGAASYPLYLLHPIVLLPSLLFVTQWPIHPFVAFAAHTTFGLVGTLVLAAVLQRSGIMRLLLGLKGQRSPKRTLLVSNSRNPQDGDWLGRTLYYWFRDPA